MRNIEPQWTAWKGDRVYVNDSVLLGICIGWYCEPYNHIHLPGPAIAPGFIEANLRTVC